MSDMMRLGMKTAALIAAAGLAIGGSVPSRAAEIQFSYVIPENSNVISGTLVGALLAGTNDYDISSFQTLFVNGAAVTTPATVVSADAAFLGTSVPPEITLDGTFLDLFAYAGPNLLVFAVGDQTSADYGSDFAGATPGYGGVSGSAGTYVPANFSASLVSVPEAGALALLALPLGMMASLRLRRRGNAA